MFKYFVLDSMNLSEIDELSSYKIVFNCINDTVKSKFKFKNSLEFICEGLGGTVVKYSPPTSLGS